MALNENTVKGKWLEIKGDIQTAWAKLTDDELEKTRGDAKAIGGLIQQKYGAAQDTYGTKIADIFKKFEDEKGRAVSDVRENLKG